MKTYHKSLILSVLFMMTFAFFSCKEDWEPFEWAVDNKNPENIAVSGLDMDEYTGQITVVADDKECDVVLLCKNYSNLYIESSYTPSVSLKDGFDNGEVSVKVDGNKINIHFYPINDINEEHSMIIINVKTHEDKHPLNLLMLVRAQDINNPFPDA